MMRQTDLVVNYRPGEPMSNELLQYGGVFRADSDADLHFAEAEPPTHDDWVLPDSRVLHEELYNWPWDSSVSD